MKVNEKTKIKTKKNLKYEEKLASSWKHSWMKLYEQCCKEIMIKWGN
jgi:hypothetical protein